MSIKKTNTGECTWFFPFYEELPRRYDKRFSAKPAPSGVDADSLVKRRLATLTPPQVFLGLGNKLWMQLIDGRDHRYGKRVYDEGLHGKDKEPGYLASAEAACQYAHKHLLDSVTPAYYKKLHDTACAHFKKGVTGRTDAEEVNRFEAASLIGTTIPDFFSYSFPPNHKMLQEIERVKKILVNYQRYHVRDSDEDFRERFSISKEDQDFFETDFLAHVGNAVEDLNKYIGNFRYKDDTPLAVFKVFQGTIRLYYRYGKFDSSMESILENIFKEFHVKIDKAKTEDEKIECIAHLFQVLEWLHPFPDGQGRTDLILLAQLLCKYGLNPPILEYPYVSTYSKLDGWVDYLKTGMERWRKEFSQT